MGRKFSTLDDPRAALEPPSGADAGDRIEVGNLSGTVAAIGRGAQVIVHQARSAADDARSVEDFEHEKLATAVSSFIQRLYDQVCKTQPVADSPYKYLLPYEFGDAWYFFGRDAFREEVLSAMRGADLNSRLVVLHGDAGLGKTSLLRASIAPALLADGHLPLRVRVSQEPVSTSLKKALLPNLSQLEGLQHAPLCDFLREVQDLLPEGARVCVLLDQFEEFFNLPQAERERFTKELADCLLSEPPVGHWLISIQSARVGYLSTLAPEISQPLANTLVLPPLTPNQAREAILGPADMAGMKVEDALVDALLRDLGGDAIDPSEIQLICHTLALEACRGDRSLTLDAYEKSGRAETILRDHLSLVLRRNLPAEDQETAWQALAAVDAHPGGTARDEVVAELKSREIGQEKALRMLEILELNRLVRIREGVYRLTSASLREPVRKWKEQRTAREQAQIEARRQLERVRDSALRGLFGGGVAFSLAFIITYWFQVRVNEMSFIPILAMLDALAGGAAGVAFIFLLDIVRASFHWRRRLTQVLLGGIGGAVIFALAFLFLKLPNATFLDYSELLLAAAQGGLWGLVVGAAIAAISLTRRPLWQTVPLFTVLSTAALLLGESFGGVYQRPHQRPNMLLLQVTIALAGALMFLILTWAALLGRRREAAAAETAPREEK